MRIYYDTSVLVKLFIPEIGSRKYAEFVRKNKKPLLINIFQETELKNAFALKAFRKEIVKKELNGIMKQIENDFNTQTLIRQPLEFGQLFALINELSGKHTISIGCRTLDIIHVAAASLLGFDKILTNDSRQKELAKKIGIKVANI